MNVPSLLTRHRGLRWLVPAGIGGIAAVASLVATGVFQTEPTQSGRLPRMTPAALLADVQAAPSTGFSGTVLSRVSLGLPELPTLGGASDDGTSFASLLSGSHTLQVWYGGADEQRVALLGATDETDLFRSGRRIWMWTSSDRVARHAVLPAQTRPEPDPVAAATPTATPSALATQVLGALSASTQVQVRTGTRVADRTAYELTLIPRTAATRVASVQIAVDAATKLPLAVRVYARGTSAPSIDVAFTSVHFVAPPKTYFTFSPPSGATVRPLRVGSTAQRMFGAGSRVLGTGWTRVVELDSGRAVNTGRGQLGRVLTPVSGSWGSGGLLQSDLLCVLVTDRGRVFAGAVEPAALYAAAATK